MVLKSFKAEGFRNIESCDISFSPGVNLLHGMNAEGKTNAIEGIYLFSRGKSFRAGEERELIKEGRDGFHISIKYEDKSGEGVLEYSLFGRQRLRRKNGYKISRISEMIGSFKSVLFLPDDLCLVKYGPDERRSFLNVAISQCEPCYIDFYSNFKKAYESRNRLIKEANKGLYYDRGELICWSETMAEYASHIYISRKKYIERLEFFAKKIIEEISGGRENLRLHYKNDISPQSENLENVKECYKKKLTENLEKEINVGNSLYGPTRDDIEIYLSGFEAKRYASQGQQRSIVLALKLAEGEVIKEMYGEYPVFLFDDVLSELDIDRRKYVISGMRDRQIIISSCSDEEIKDFADCVIEASGGNYVSSYR